MKIKQITSFLIIPLIIAGILFFVDLVPFRQIALTGLVMNVVCAVKFFVNLKNET